MEKGQSERNLNQMKRLKKCEVGECCIKTLSGMKWKTGTQNSEAPFLSSRKRVKKSKNIIYITFPDGKAVT